MKQVILKTILLMGLLLLPLVVGQAQNDNIAVLDWNFDGTKLAIGYRYGTVEIRDMSTEETKLIELPSHLSLTSLAWSPTDNRLAVATQRGLVRIFDVETDQIVLVLEAGDYVEEVIWWPDGTKIVTAIMEGTYPFENNLVMEWDAVTGESYGDIWGAYPGEVAGIALSPDNNYMAVAAVGSKTAIWPRTEDTPIYLDGGANLAWSPDGSRIAIGGLILRIWSWPNPELLVSFQASEYIRDIMWSADGTQMALIDRQHIYVLETATGQVLYSTETTESLHSIAWNPNQNTLVYGGTDAIAHIIAPSDLSTPTPTFTPTRVPLTGP